MNLSHIWTLLPWSSRQKIKPGKLSNIIGATAYVGSNGLTKNKGGEVTWSGTIMKARLAKDSMVEKLEAGSQVTVVEISGATLMVKPKS